jgi:hypothetical protein
MLFGYQAADAMTTPSRRNRGSVRCARISDHEKPRVFLQGSVGGHVSDRYWLEPGLIARFVAVDDGLDESDAL